MDQIDQLEQAFQELYFEFENYENVRTAIDPHSYVEVATLMEKYVELYLDVTIYTKQVYQKVQNRLYSYSYDNQLQAEHYIEQMNGHWMRIQNIAEELGNYKQISNSFKIHEYHKNRFQDRIFQDNKINNTIKEILKTYKFQSQIEIRFNRLLQYFNPAIIKTNSEFTEIKLQQSISEQGNDEIKEFEKRLESGIINLPDEKKQQPKLPPGWEINMVNIWKKKKKRFMNSIKL